MPNRWGNSGWLYFWVSKITADGDCSNEIQRHLLLGRKVMTNLDSIIKSRDITLSTKVCLVGYGFPTSHVWMWESDCKESWVQNWCFWTVLLEKTLESPLDFKEIKPVNPKSILGVHWKDWCWSWNSNTLAIWCEELTQLKRPCCWERLRAGGEGTTEDEMVGWHHWLNGHGFGWTLGVGDGQEALACIGSWGQ